MVTIGDVNRLYGADSFLEASKYPQTTFQQIPQVFGAKYDEAWVAKYKNYNLLFNTYVPDSRGQIAWEITSPEKNADGSQMQ